MIYDALLIALGIAIGYGFRALIAAKAPKVAAAIDDAAAKVTKKD